MGVPAMTASNTTSFVPPATKPSADPASLAVGVAPTPLSAEYRAVTFSNAAVSLLSATKLNIPQAARRIGIGETKMRLIVQHGEIPVLRIGGKTVIIEQDMEIYLRGNYGRMALAAKPTIKPTLTALPKEVSESPWLKKNGTES